jgi:hypothetical protein
MRRGSQRRNIGGELALEHRPDEDGSAGGVFHRSRVGDERALQPGRQLRREIAGLVGVREQHERRRQLRDRLL